MRITKLLWMVPFAALSLVPVMAQDPDQAQGKGEAAQAISDRMNEMAAKLNLTDDQKAKVKPILQDSASQMRALRDDQSLSRRDKFKKMRDIRSNRDNQLKSVLNDDQFKQLKEMEKENQQKMREQMRQRKG